MCQGLKHCRVSCEPNSFQEAESFQEAVYKICSFF